MCCLCILTSPERAQVRSMRALGSSKRFLEFTYLSRCLMRNLNLYVLFSNVQRQKVLASAVGEIEQSRFMGSIMQRQSNSRLLINLMGKLVELTCITDPLV